LASPDNNTHSGIYKSLAQPSQFTSLTSR
jgi:hypothetical protein